MIIFFKCREFSLKTPFKGSIPNYQVGVYVSRTQYHLILDYSSYRFANEKFNFVIAVSVKDVTKTPNFWRVGAIPLLTLLRS